MPLFVTEKECTCVIALNSEAEGMPVNVQVADATVSEMPEGSSEPLCEAHGSTQAPPLMTTPRATANDDGWVNAHRSADSATTSVLEADRDTHTVAG